jgi:hypothetical protein
MYSIVGSYSFQTERRKITVTHHEHFFEMEQDDERVAAFPANVPSTKEK